MNNIRGDESDISAKTASLVQIADARSLCETDRDVMEKGTKAFVSHVRGYKEHHCKFIFRIAEVDMNLLGRLFGLLRLPAMQEVRFPPHAPPWLSVMFF